MINDLLHVPTHPPLSVSLPLLLLSFPFSPSLPPSPLSSLSPISSIYLSLLFFLSHTSLFLGTKDFFLMSLA